jgi:hypothetical protein
MGKKGGGGGQAPQVGIPAGISQTIGSTSGLGGYASALLNPLAGMTNWAANLASGGAAGQIPSFKSVAQQPGPQVQFDNKGAGGSNLWNSVFDPTTGLVTFTNAHAPQQTFTENINGGQLGNLPSQVVEQWRSDYSQHQTNQNQSNKGDAPGGVGVGGTSLSPDSYNSLLKQGWTAEQLQSQFPAKSSQSLQDQLGPFLGSAWNAIETQKGLPAKMAPVEAQTSALANEAQGEGASLMGQGQSELNMATTGSGLFPSQQAYITEARQTGETGAAAELAKLGLSNSTMAPQMKEQADLAAAGTAGQLVQGNIQAAQNTIALGQASQKIALGAQTLETGEQQAVFEMYSAIAQESEQFQRNLWDEALSGYGALGSIIGTAAGAYGVSLQGYQQMLSALEANAQIQAQADQQAAQADASSSAGLLGGLGKILGGLGGAAGGAAAGGGLAAGGAAGAAIGGGGSAIAGIGGALTALFCQVAQTVYGFDNPKWNRFRAWLLLRAPLWVVRLYGRHAATVSDWLYDKPILKWCVASLMDIVSYADSRRRPC